MIVEVTIKSKWDSECPITHNIETYRGSDVYVFDTDKSFGKTVDFATRYFNAEHPKREILSITIEVI